MNKWEAKTRKYARKHGLGEWFVRQMRHESAGFNEDVIAGRRDSPAGARGIAQIMPATARGWGVDPLDPDAALDAAARNMRKYVKEHGSVEKALRAYNAGPGAIEKSRGYAETNKYVAVILGGNKIPKLRQPQKDATATPRLAERAAASSADVDGRAAFTQSVALGFLQRNKQPGQGLIDVVRNAHAAAAQALDLAEAFQPETSSADSGTPPKPDRGTSVPGSRAKGGPVIKELFHDPVGGWDEGTNIGPIGGHGSHIHVAARSKGAIRAIARAAQRRGLTVRELEGFDPVDPVHTKKSLHYSDLAADLSGDPKKMVAFTKWIQRRYGLK